MMQDLDRMLQRLSEQPMPEKVGRLEDELARQMRRPNRTATTHAWRSVAVSLALAAGLGIGGSAAAWNGAHGQSGDFLTGAQLAPSALLTNSK